MRHFGGFGLALFCAAGLFGQGFGGRNPVASSGFGHVFSPARRSIPGLPAGGHARPTTGAAAYAYPVYVGGYGYAGGYADSYGDDFYPPDGGAPPPAPAPSQPNVTVVYPPQQTTVIINSSPDGGPPNVSVLQGPPMGPPPMARRPAPGTSSNASNNNDESDTPHYLIAFKDHTIYSAVAYWVDGDTLHYFTTPSTHNQVSLALVDRDLTQRLNQESGVDLKLPPPPSSSAK